MTDPTVDELDIDEIPELISALHSKLLTDFDAGWLDPEAEQYFLLALETVNQAKRFATLAVYKTRQARAEGK